MKKIYQRSDSDCFNSCIASLLDMEYEDVPEFRKHGQNMFQEACKWLLDKGHKVRLSNPTMGKYLSARELSSFSGDVIAGLDIDTACHAIIINNSKLVHDPRSEDIDDVDMTRIMNIIELVPTKQ